MTVGANIQLQTLVIEDNEDLAQLFGNLLQILGCQVHIASNALNGLQMVHGNPPDILFCDLKIPGEKTGFDVAREIRADTAYKDVWLVAITGLAHPESLQRAHEAGFDRVYRKPVKLAELRHVLAEFQKARHR